MTKEQAMNLITQACSQYKGTLQEHQMLQQAIELLKKEVLPVEPKDGESK